MFWGGLNGDDFYPDYDGNSGYPSEGYGSPKDPLFYHTEMSKFIKIKHETERAYLFTFYDKFDLWMPKKLVKINCEYIFIHTAIGIDVILKEAVVNHAKEELKNKKEAKKD
jgi:hypothetical protein